MTDAPEDFHFMAAESLLSITVGRRAFIKFSYGKCYLNTYLMVVAPPSARKSTEFGIMKPVLDAIMKNDAMLPLKTTPEQLLNMMSRNSQRLYTSDEYSIFLADAKKKYNDGIISDIVKLYDSPDTYLIGRVGGDRASDSGNISINDVYLNQLVFIQPEAFKTHFTDYHFSIGLPQRFQTIFIDKFEKRPRKKENEADQQAIQDVIDTLKSIDSHLSNYVEICFSDEQNKYIFENIEAHYDKELSSDSLLATFPSRFADQVYKLSALTSIDEKIAATFGKSIHGEKINRVEVSIDNVEWAIDALTKRYFTPFIDHVKDMRNTKVKTYSDYEKVLEKVKRLIQKHDGQIGRSKLLQLGNFLKDDLNKFEKQAIEENQIIVKTVGKKKIYRLQSSATN